MPWAELPCALGLLEPGRGQMPCGRAGVPFETSFEVSFSQGSDAGSRAGVRFDLLRGPEPAIPTKTSCLAFSTRNGALGPRRAMMRLDLRPRYPTDPLWDGTR